MIAQEEIDDKQIQKVLLAYGFGGKEIAISRFGSGLINKTWIIRVSGVPYVLQQINTQVFGRPWEIDQNIAAVSNYIHKHNPSYTLVVPIPDLNGNTLLKKDGQFFRIIPFVAASHTIDVVSHAGQAYEAAKAFSQFSAVLDGFDTTKLHHTIAGFHNLSARFIHFKDALSVANPVRKMQSNDLIRKLLDLSSIVATYQKITSSPEFTLRVMHHDTKISNVLFNDEDKEMGVIDLDTIMPGFFISDVGDMMRTYLSPVSEEEADYSRIFIRDEMFEAIVSGYQIYMGDKLSAVEKDHFYYSAIFMVYMQAIRFLGDYLLDDTYYGSKYEGQNLVRAENQYTLLCRLLEKESSLKALAART